MTNETFTVSQAVYEGMVLAVAPDTLVTEHQAEALASAITNIVKEVTA